MTLKRLEMVGLLLLTAAGFLIHGYHPFSEDAETYLPGIEKILNPNLFPIGNEYFELHAHLTWFPQLIAYSVRLTHLPLSGVLLIWQIISFFLFLLACWQLLRRLFPSVAARWAGLALITTLFTMPVAGTALYLMDPFLNPRNIIAFAEIFCLVKVLERKYVQAILLIAFAISIHPLMSMFTASFCALVLCIDRWPWKGATSLRRAEQTVSVAGSVAMFSPVEKLFDAPTAAYDKVAGNHRYQFLARWTWYEMLGALAPILLFWWFRSIARARRWLYLELLCTGMMIYGTVYFVAGLVVSIPRRLEMFSLLQPMRSLHLLYVLMLLIAGGLIGEYVLKSKAWRWVVLFVPIAVGMWFAQRELYPASAHIEWPWAEPRNPWVQSFEWAKRNTPEQAIFALDPYYMNAEGEDAAGFRAIAERSQLADGAKDSGVVELFPQIGESWSKQVQAQTGIYNFQRKDFEPLQRQYGVNWVVLKQPGHADLDCPYQNAVVKVCRLP